MIAGLPDRSRAGARRGPSLRQQIARAIGGAAATEIAVDGKIAVAIAAIPPAPTTWVLQQKPSDTARNTTTTLTDDPSLQVSVNPSALKIIRGKVRYTTSVAAGFKWDLSGPAAPTKVDVERYEILPGAVALSDVAVDAAYTSAQTRVVAATSVGVLYFEARIVNGANSGNVAFRWAQGVSDGADTKVLAGSYLEVL